MTKTLAIFALFAALLFGFKAYTLPESAPGRYLHNTIDPAVSGAVKSFQQLPFVNLLDWEGVNDYKQRPTLQPLRVVSPHEAGYTPEELSEIYLSH